MALIMVHGMRFEASDFQGAFKSKLNAVETPKYIELEFVAIQVLARAITHTRVISKFVN